MRFHGLLLVACLSLAVQPAAASEAFDKGKADGTAFGERTGKKKGAADGKARGNEDGFKKGYEDARLQAPAPTAPPEPTPEPTPSPSPTPEPTPEPPSPTPEPTPEPPAPTPEPTPEPPSPTPEPTPEPPSPTPEPEPVPSNPPGSQDEPVPAPGVSVHRGAPAEPEFTVPLSGKLVDAEAFALARASALRAEESPESQALVQYPDLVPMAPTASNSPSARIPGFSDEEIAYGQDYTKGFALGYVEALAKAYAAARDEAYGPAWTEGYARGQAEYRRLASGPDGAPLTPDAAIDLARKAMLLGRFEEAVNRLDILIASPGSTAHLDAALYWKAATYYYWGKKERAIEAARKVSANPASAYADDAYFLAGAAFEGMTSGGFLGMFGKRHDKEAAEQYEIVVAQFASSKIVPSALLRLGACRERLRQKAAAIAAYKRLVSEFAAAPEATRARLRLKALGAD